jgi:hypothetical protein
MCYKSKTILTSEFGNSVRFRGREMKSSAITAFLVGLGYDLVSKETPAASSSICGVQLTSNSELVNIIYLSL